MKIPSLLSAMFFSTVALFGYAGPLAATEQPAASNAQPAAADSPAPATQPEPMAVLKQMATYLRSLERFKVRVEKTTELILPTDQRLHQDQTVEIALQKPDRLRADFQNLSGGRQLFYDGKTFTLYTPAPNVYASATAAPTIDETLALLEDEYGISMFITDLLLADPESSLVRNLESKTYVGQTLVRGVACHHLAFQTPEVDWEIWIEDGPKPLPRRLLLTDKSVEGSPQWTSDLSDWNLTPQFPTDFFTFTPPQDAQKIKFLDALPAAQPTKTAK